MVSFDYEITKDENSYYRELYYWELIASYPGCNEDSGYNGLDNDYWTREIVSSGYAATEKLAIEIAEKKVQEYEEKYEEEDDEEDGED
jgi:hypothetical protein